MSETERIMLECRYYLSLEKSFHEIARYLHEDDQTVFEDLSIKLSKIDSSLYQKIQKKLNFYK